MITREQAERLVYEEINLPDLRWPNRPEMIVVRIEERNSGWLVYWTSRPWHETGDFRHAIAGNGPYLVGREDGFLIRVGTAGLIEDRIQEAEHELATRQAT